MCQKVLWWCDISKLYCCHFHFSSEFCYVDTNICIFFITILTFYATKCESIYSLEIAVYSKLVKKYTSHSWEYVIWRPHEACWWRFGCHICCWWQVCSKATCIFQSPMKKPAMTSHSHCNISKSLYLIDVLSSGLSLSPFHSIACAQMRSGHAVPPFGLVAN